MKRREFIKGLSLSIAAPMFTGVLASCTKPGSLLVEPVLQDGQTILFIGDSITYAAGYIDFIQTFLIARYPEKKFKIYGMGLSSETVEGLTEPGHPYPRPNIHDRLQRILDRTQPDIVVACYGMNDGIYHPLAEERFTPFKAGINKLIERITGMGAKLYLLTPPPFDPVPAANRIVGPDADRFGFDATFQDYDNVLLAYGQWIMQLSAPGLTTVDIHKPMLDFLQANRKTNPDYYLARDGVHPGAVGHWIMAQTLLKAWGEQPLEQSADIRIKSKTIKGDVENADFSGGDVAFDWHLNVPVALQSEEMRQVSGLVTHMVWPLLRVEQSGVNGYKCYANESMFQSFKREALAEGIDLTGYPSFGLTRRAVKLMNLVRQRRNLYDHALLNDIGHTLPQKEKPLSLAEAEAQLPEIDQAIYNLSRPEVVKMRLVPYI